MSANINTLLSNENVSKTKLQELNELFMLLKEEKLKYIETDIFLNTILESATCKYGIKDILGVKIRDIILRGELMNVLRIKEEISSSEITLLGKYIILIF